MVLASFLTVRLSGSFVPCPPWHSKIHPCQALLACLALNRSWSTFAAKASCAELSDCCSTARENYSWAVKMRQVGGRVKRIERADGGLPKIGDA
jgi:hypothetical protein